MTVLVNRPLGSVGLGMLGLDVHTKGIRTLSRRLAGLGCDVTFLGEHLTVDELVSKAHDADVDLIGISFSSGAYVDHCREVADLLRERNLDIPIMVGGLIHQDDRTRLEEMGVRGIFGPGSQIEDIIAFIQGIAQERVSRKSVDIAQVPEAMPLND